MLVILALQSIDVFSEAMQTHSIEKQFEVTLLMHILCRFFNDHIFGQSYKMYSVHSGIINGWCFRP